MSRSDPLRIRDYLEHIAQAIANIRDYTAGMDAAAYLADPWRTIEIDLPSLATAVSAALNVIPPA
jgi:uncharacterized protein with HEPN domain